MCGKDKKLSTVVIGLLTLGIVLIGGPVLRVAGWGVEQTYTLREMSESWGWVVTLVRLMNIAAIVCLLLLILEKVEATIWWFLPAAAANGCALLGVATLLMKKNEVVSAYGMGYLMNYLSIEYTATTSAWIFMLASALSLACIIKLILNRLYDSPKTEN